MSDQSPEIPPEKAPADPSLLTVEGVSTQGDNAEETIDTATTGDGPALDRDNQFDQSNPLSIYHELCRENNLPVLKSVNDAIETSCEGHTDSDITLRFRGDQREHGDKLSDIQCLLICQALQKSSTSVGFIDLSHNPIKDDGCTAVASLITRNTRLIRLRGCLLGKDGAFKVLEAIKNSQCELGELDLSDNAIGTDAGVAIAKYMRLSQIINSS
ncbi:hypothetical protein FOL47_001615 [Perkinsus chesapeaki]|uniref:T-complex-associated testis-expressed protein 1 n=1 Tax=Perkinsus chesapeaki TaxID=330153 RepID=A0A7J6N0K6_PERCH|nr:hypothetical protein FOL47_001615 [Perkinsus chesapeaki]